MKRVWQPVATSALCSDGILLHPDSLRENAANAKSRIIPALWNHDFRIPPVGRIVDARTSESDDGIVVLEALFELFDKSDSAESLSGETRRIEIATSHTPAVELDRVAYDLIPSEMVAELRDIVGATETKSPMLKRSAATIPEIVVYFGVFALAGISHGFFNEIGAELARGVRDWFRKARQQGLRRSHYCAFEFIVKSAHAEVPVRVFIDDPLAPDAADIDLVHLAAALDSSLPGIDWSRSDIASVVFRWSDGSLTLAYVLRVDGVPLDGEGRLIFTDPVQKYREGDGTT